jgi:hypothetical protein
MTDVKTMESPLSRGKRIALIIFGALVVFLLVSPPEFDAFMMFTASSSQLDGGAHILHIFNRGAGALVTVASALVLIFKPSWAVGALQKFVATAVGFMIAAVLSMHVWPPVVVYPIFAIILAALILWAFRGRLPWQQPVGQRPAPSRPMLALTAIVAVPLVAFAFSEAALQRGPEMVHGDLGHWGSAAAMAFMIIIMMAFAALRMPGWRVPGWGAAFMLFMFGAASIYWPNQASSIGELWGTLAIVGAVAFLGVAELEHRLFARTAEAPATTGT